MELAEQAVLVDGEEEARDVGGQAEDGGFLGQRRIVRVGGLGCSSHEHASNQQEEDESVDLLPAAPRVNGRRRYDASVLRRLAVVDLAQQAGFTIGEIRTLLHGFSRRAPPSLRWRKLAKRKLCEIEERIERAQAMKRVLTRLQRCECPTLEDCAAARGAQG